LKTFFGFIETKKSLEESSELTCIPSIFNKTIKNISNKICNENKICICHLVAIQAVPFTGNKKENLLAFFLIAVKQKLDLAKTVYGM